MTEQRARELYVKLRELAARPGTPAEGESAAAVAAELKEKFGFADRDLFGFPYVQPDPAWESFREDVRSGRSTWQQWAPATGVFRRPEAQEGAVSREAPSFAFREDELDVEEGRRSVPSQNSGRPERLKPAKPRGLLE